MPGVNIVVTDDAAPADEQTREQVRAFMNTALAGDGGADNTTPGVSSFDQAYPNLVVTHHDAATTSALQSTAAQLAQIEQRRVRLQELLSQATHIQSELEALHPQPAALTAAAAAVNGRGGVREQSQTVTTTSPEMSTSTSLSAATYGACAATGLLEQRRQLERLQEEQENLARSVRCTRC
jgi:hypothetical protein